MKKTLLIVGFSLVLLATIGLIVWAKLSPESDPTFNNDPAWPREAIPLAVVSYGSHADVVADAVNGINADLGFTVLEYHSYPSEDISVHMDVPAEVGQVELGTSQRTIQRGHVSHCFVTISNVPTELVRYRTVYHELGHCLGLAHDHSRQSIMYPTISDEFGLTGFSDQDRNALRGRYKP